MAARIPKTNVWVAPRPVRFLESPGVCRFCKKGVAWFADEAGPLHRCCEMWQVELAAGRSCLGCGSSRAATSKELDKKDGGRRGW